MTANNRKIARLAGITYLVQMATSIIGYYPPQLLGSTNITAAAINIIHNETLFRVGIAANLTTYITVLLLNWSLYNLLKPANKNLALLALLLRVVEVIVLSVGILGQLMAVRLLTNPDYIDQFKPDQLYAFAKLGMIFYGRAFEVGFVFLGLGSMVFSYILLKSRYVPKPLAVLGISSSLLIALGSFTSIIVPEVKIIFPYGYGPMFIFEVGLGLWLLVRGIKIPSVTKVF